FGVFLFWSLLTLLFRAWAVSLDRKSSNGNLPPPALRHALFCRSAELRGSSYLGDLRRKNRRFEFESALSIARVSPVGLNADRNCFHLGSRVGRDFRGTTFCHSTRGT